MRMIIHRECFSVHPKVLLAPICTHERKAVTLPKKHKHTSHTFIYYIIKPMRAPHILLIAALLWLSTTLSAQNTHYETYIETYKEMAIEQMHRHGIPASITLAQGLLESGAGRSMLAVKANNHFGIKCGGTWNGPYMLKDDDERNEKFRVYNSPRESYEDHSLFLTTRGRYSFLFSLNRTDYKGWAHGLKQAGYATNPRYAYSLIDIIERYDLARFAHMKPGQSHQRRHTTTLTSPQGNTPQQWNIGRCNDNYYVIARSGDTYAAIAQAMGIRERKLRKYNEVGRKHTLQAGDIVYLEKKRKKADRSMKGKYHIVQTGESLHRIAQLYGIRIKTLYQNNDLPDNYVPTPGQYLRIR